MRGLEKIENGLKNGKIGLRSADIGRYGPAPAENIKFYWQNILFELKKPIWPETGQLQSVNRDFVVKLSDFGSAVERQNDFGEMWDRGIL